MAQFVMAGPRKGKIHKKEESIFSLLVLLQTVLKICGSLSSLVIFHNI